MREPPAAVDPQARDRQPGVGFGGVDEIGAPMGDSLDLLVTDVMMPRMLGTELAEGGGTERPDVRVLFVSGYTDSPAIQDWVDRDPNSFLAKPFEPEELLEAVERRLAPPGPQACSH